MKCRKYSLVSLSYLFAALALVGGGVADETPAKDPAATDKDAAVAKDVTQGALRIVQDDATVIECPLTHTDVKAEVSGFIAKVNVTQTFHNPTKEPIEAVYVFPLPHGSAVNEMTMVVGQRRVVGLIKRRAAAREIYEQAILSGQIAALLEQERPNIFTQTVGNIPPGAEINIEISYIDVLNYDVGNYEFHFPMVVGPRYNPGSLISPPVPRADELKGKVSPPERNTVDVPDATRINPAVLKPQFRTGHDISLSVSLDAGVPIQNLSSANHRADIDQQGQRHAAVTLANSDSLPNKDFVLRYNVVGKKPEMALLAHTGDYSGDARRLGKGYFMLMIQPQEDERLTKSPPREMVFMVDVSGSMRGQPTAKTIEAMRTMLGLCRPIDTVQVITFAGQATKLFDKPVPVDEASIKTALNFTAGLRGRGGTEMLKGIKLAIDEPIDANRMRIVVMLSDGYIGNEAQIIEHVGKNCGDQIRFWAIGMGSSPNMFLIDGVARQGGGMGKRLGLQDDSESLSHEIMTRIQRAQLTNVKIDWGDLQVAETYPARIPELWAGRPVILFGRYGKGGSERITVSGRVEGEDVSWPLDVDLRNDLAEHKSLASVWARKKIEDLMQQTYYADSPAIEEEVTAIALDYRLMSQYTSFVAVDAEKLGELNDPARPPRRMEVPVPLPEGTSWKGFFGESQDIDQEYSFYMPFSRKAKPATEMILGRARGKTAVRRQSLYLAKSPSQLVRSPQPALGAAYFRSYRQQAVAGTNVRFTARGSWAFTDVDFGMQESKRLVADLDSNGASQVALSQQESRHLVRLSAEQAKPVREAAVQALQAATKFENNGQFAEARAALIRTILLDATLVNAGQAGAQITQQALPALERVHAQQVKAWVEDNPALGKKLDLVIRDKSLAESLEMLAVATGIKIELLSGSTEDATTMTRDDVRVNYLDLRRATVAQALDWILHPRRMSWHSESGAVIAATDRRRPGASAWIHDVSRLLPAGSELQEAGANATKQAAAATDKLMTSLRADLKFDDPLSMLWFSPGHLLVVGDTDQHASVDNWMAEQRSAVPEAIASTLR